MKAGYFQFNPEFGNKEKNIDKIATAVKQSNVDLIVLPEFFATGYQFISRDEVADLSEYIPQGRTASALSDLSTENKTYIVAGLPERKGEKFYNSALITGPDGFIGVYRKTHLFLEEKLYFTPGDTGFRVWETDIGRIGVMICFDWFFPEAMRTLAIMRAEVVAHPSNLVLPFCPDAMPVRCLENSVYGVTANRTGAERRKEDQSLTFIGKSQVVSPRGDILIRASENEEVFSVVDIDPQKARDKSLNPFNDILKDRRPEMYSNYPA